MIKIFLVILIVCILLFGLGFWVERGISDYKAEKSKLIEPQIVEKIVEVEILINNDIINHLNQLNFEYWELVHWTFEDLHFYELRIALNDGIHISRKVETLTELISIIDEVEGIQDKLSE